MKFKANISIDSGIAQDSGLTLEKVTNSDVAFSTYAATYSGYDMVYRPNGDVICLGVGVATRIPAGGGSNVSWFDSGGFNRYYSGVPLADNTVMVLDGDAGTMRLITADGISSSLFKTLTSANNGLALFPNGDYLVGEGNILKRVTPGGTLTTFCSTSFTNLNCFVVLSTGEVIVGRSSSSILQKVSADGVTVTTYSASGFSNMSTIKALTNNDVVVADTNDIRYVAYGGGVPTTITTTGYNSIGAIVVPKDYRWYFRNSTEVTEYLVVGNKVLKTDETGKVVPCEFLRDIDYALQREQIDYVLPITKSTVTNQWFKSYDSVTGLFTSTQPLFSELGSKPTTLAGYGITDAVINTRTITLNGVAQDLSVNRSWTASQLGVNKTTIDALGINATHLGGVLASGYVTKVGTPVNNQIGVWTGDGTIKGDPNFTWDGVSLSLDSTSYLARINRSVGTFYSFNKTTFKSTTQSAGAVLVYDGGDLDLNLSVNGLQRLDYGVGQTLSLVFPTGVPTQDAIWTLPLNKTGTIALTSDITASVTGTTNYIPKFTSANVIGNSQIFDNGTNVGIGTTSLTSKFTAKRTTSGNVATFVSQPAANITGDYAGITLSVSENGDYGSEIRSINTDSNPNLRLGFFTQDTDTYLAASKTERLSILGNGNVGIGTTTPTAKLDIYDTFSTAIQFSNSYTYLNTNAYRARIEIDDAHNLWFKAKRGLSSLGDIYFTRDVFDIKTITIKGDTGNVGIGTASPTNTLSLGSGNTGLSFNSAASSFNSGKVGEIVSEELGSGNGNLHLKTYQGGSGGDTRMTILNNGNVGIGTTAPDYTLDVSGTGRFTGKVKGLAATAADEFITKAQLDASAGGGKKSYIGQINQSGTAAPTVTTIFENSIGAIVWTRSSAGVYIGTLTGAFTSAKTIGYINNSAVSSGTRIGTRLIRLSADTIEIKADLGGTLTDNMIGSANIFLYVYN